VRDFRRGRRERSPDADAERLLAPVQRLFDDLVRRPAGSSAADDAAWAAFRRTVSGPGGSPGGPPAELAAHRFDRHALFEPLRPHEPRSGEQWRADLLDHLRRDNAAAAQGNLRNPAKAACDGVWRDLRSVLSRVLDFGGLTAGSQRRFLSTAARSYARMSNGTGLEPMRKVQALVEAGVVDVAIGPGPRVEPVPGRPAFRLHGSLTGAVREVQVLVEGRAHPFDPEWDAHPLYPALLRRGLVRRWRNPGRPPEPDLVPGALDLTRDFHPIGADGTVQRRLTVLGSPAEGLAFFQLSAARPRSGSAVLGAVAQWAADVARSVSPSGPPS
jgi:hypothetical protein